MFLAHVVEASRQVASTTKRLAKVQVLADLLKQLRGDEIEVVVAFLSGVTRQGRIGVGYSAIGSSTVAASASASLEIQDVDGLLSQLSMLNGPGSGEKRLKLLRSLMARATADEQQFLRELLLGGLRQGALDGIMLDAVARAGGVSLASVQRASMLAGNTARVAQSLLESDTSSLDEWNIRLFQPVRPMLARPSPDVETALSEIGEAALEYKLDGARIQAHKNGDEVRLYTRALNDVTSSAPEVAEAVRALPANDLILDGEVISFAADGRPRPFQVTMRRFGRRNEMDRMQMELPLTPAWFDILYCNGQPLIDKTQAERRAILRDLVPPEHLVRQMRTVDVNAAAAFLKASLEAGHEGIMVKAVDSPYAAGARGQSWLKVKKVHTLDLVILAAEWGSGRRHKWLSNLHLGARDTATCGFAMLGKTFKGMTDEMLQWQTGQLLSLEVSRQGSTVFVEPKIVAEIAYSDIQMSSRYPGGFALRFARVKRYRPDKTAADADTLETVRTLAAPDLHEQREGEK